MSIVIPSTPFTLPTTQLLPPIPITSQAGVTYTFNIVDAQTWVRFTNVAGCTITVPLGVFQVGILLTAEAATPGLVQFVGAAGVILLPASPVTALAQSSVVAFLQVDVDVWNAFGEHA